jgi:hypothetical protein
MPSIALVRRITTSLLGVVLGVSVLAPLASHVAAEETSSTLSSWTLANPALPDGVTPLGQGRVAEHQGLSYLLYGARYTAQPWVLVRDPGSGATSHVALPQGTTGGTAWARADIAVAGEHLWVLSGAGPVHLRHYRLSGAPLANSAVLVDEHVLGDADSRAGALTSLTSGAVAAVWHQQGATSPQALHVAHATATGTVRLVQATGMSTRSSTQAIAQHPSDGSVWVFSSADASGTIVGVRLVEGTGLTVDRVDPELVTSARYGPLGPDPEAPDVEVAPDPATGTIAVAYQSAERRIFSTQPFVAGSYVAVARMRADTTMSFLVLPAYVERISAIGLVVRGNDTWLAHRPVAADLTSDDLHLSRHDGTSWVGGTLLGQLDDPRAMVYFGRSTATFAAPQIDNRLHVYAIGPVPSWSDGTTSTVGGDGTGGTAPATSPTKKGGGGGKGGGGRR